MKDINTLLMIAEPREDGWSVVAWANGLTLIGRTQFPSRDVAATGMEWVRDTLAPGGVSVRIEWPPRTILIDDPDNHAGDDTLILIVPKDDGGVVSWNDGRDRLEFPTWDAAEAFAVDLR